MKRTFAILVFASFARLASAAASDNRLPTTGNEMLDACGVLVSMADSPASFTALPETQFAKAMAQMSWCVGYLDATREMIEAVHVKLAVLGMAGFKLVGDGNNRGKENGAFEFLRPACLPEKTPVLQLARVLVKWLREHPARLHEFKGILAAQAFEETFPCSAASPPPTH